MPVQSRSGLRLSFRLRLGGVGIGYVLALFAATAGAVSFPFSSILMRVPGTIRNSCWAILLVIVFRDAPIGKIPATHFRLGQIGSLGCQLGLLITSLSRLRCLRSLVFPNLACLASAF